MLVSAHDGGVDHHVLVVVIARQKLENTFENSTLRPPAKALVDNFPIAETLRKIAPRNAGSVSVQNGFDEQPIIRRSAPDMAFAARQKVLDPIPLVVAKGVTAHLSAPWQPTARNHAPRLGASSVLRKSSLDGDNARSIRRARRPDSIIAPILPLIEDRP